MLLAFAACPALAEEYPIEPHDNIRAAAEQHALALGDDMPGRVEVTVGRLDSRLRLAACDKMLETYDSPNSLSGGRGMVGVRCNGSKPWKIYVPISVAVLNDVVVSSHPVVRGQAVQAGDLTVREVDTSRLRKAYFTRVEDVVGLRSKRDIPAGTALHAGLLQRAKLIKRGSHVEIIANLDGLRVTMRGEAMADGGRGDRIRVKNIDSGRVVTGTVTGSGVIEVLN